MKRLIIGRAKDCDIIIPDERDNVSRHHAVISFDFFGRMKLSDTSSNNTLINGRKMLKGTSIPVTREDIIQLGDSWIFDWNLVEDPYKRMRMTCLVLSIVLLISVIGAVTWSLHKSDISYEQNTITVPITDIDIDYSTWNKDSTDKVAPTEVNIKTSNISSTNNSNQKVK